MGSEMCIRDRTARGDRMDAEPPYKRSKKPMRVEKDHIRRRRESYATGRHQVTGNKVLFIKLRKKLNAHFFVAGFSRKRNQCPKGKVGRYSGFYCKHKS